MKTDTFSFPAGDPWPDLELPAVLDGPASASIVIVLAHGAGGDMHAPVFEAFAHGLARLGHRVLRFQFPYRARGKGAPDRMPKLLIAFASAVAEAHRRSKKETRFVYGGKSMGGRAATMLAAEGDDVLAPTPAGLLLFGYPLHPPGKPDSLRDEHLYDLKVPMLFLQGTSDRLARPDLFKPVLQKLGKRATAHWVERGDHSFKVPKSVGTPEEVMADLVKTAGDWLAKL